MENSHKQIGKILHISKPREVGEKKTKVRDFYLDLSNEYGVNTPGFVLFDDKIGLPEAAGIKAGDMVRVSYSIRGKKWEKDGKEGVNTSLVVFKIEKVSFQANNIPDIPVSVAGDDDDLPF